MVKGVNRQIIEINDTGNQYFERVLLFVAPGRSDVPESELQAQARHYVTSLTAEEGRVSLRKIHGVKKRKKVIIISGSAIIAAAAVVIAVLNIL